MGTPHHLRKIEELNENVDKMAKETLSDRQYIWFKGIVSGLSGIEAARQAGYSNPKESARLNRRSKRMQGFVKAAYEQMSIHPNEIIMNTFEIFMDTDIPAHSRLKAAQLLGNWLSLEHQRVKVEHTVNPKNVSDIIKNIFSPTTTFALSEGTDSDSDKNEEELEIIDIE